MLHLESVPSNKPGTISGTGVHSVRKEEHISDEIDGQHGDAPTKLQRRSMAVGKKSKGKEAEGSQAKNLLKPSEACKLEEKRSKSGESHDPSSKAFNFVSKCPCLHCHYGPLPCFPHFPTGASDRNSLRNKWTRSLSIFLQTMITLVEKTRPMPV